ncbi:hypothetical protein DNTS_001191 [Danionella cerebrum]|uniref:IRF tryptophan pentad repeat domain-containing protein n=1 Tax=Danionella cerebrum TaxID=2873325 RepID=A0A553Q5V8_9TELE|nr:hypothetical protein DNTS_001191 [Danionella translucida]
MRDPPGCNSQHTRGFTAPFLTKRKFPARPEPNTGTACPPPASDAVPRKEMERHMRLREWLIAQIDSGIYPGLSWENEDKSMFRIPWKHAAKQDYRQSQDAALFKFQAWAMYKGKFQEGRDKADPSTWKTRLRCALNKSTDFQEVTERSQLDISEPYKVYRILEDSGRAAEAAVSLLSNQESKCARETFGQPLQDYGPLAEADREAGWTVNGMPSVCPTGAATNTSPTALSVYPSLVPVSDCRLEVQLFYHGVLVGDTVSSSPDGCFILQGSAPLVNERIYGRCQPKKLLLPRPDLLALPVDIIEAMSRLLPHLEKGVLVWMAPDGIFIKRFCQGRVYWYGPLAEHQDQPNKLEREHTCKLFDMSIFSKELQNYQQGLGPVPRYIVIPLFAQECLNKHKASSNEMKPPTASC